jgi:integrase
MASVWLSTYTAKDGTRRHRVYFRLGGRESTPRYGGSFKTKREANARKAWISGELSALRVPELRKMEAAPTLAHAVARWRESRLDVRPGTRVFHRVALERLLPHLGGHRLEQLTVEALNEAIVALAAAGRKPATIRKSMQTLATLLDDAGVEPNPARDKRLRYPYQEPVEPQPPTCEHVEAVYRLLPPAYRLPLLWLDWSGARLASVETVTVGDYDERARRVRLRAATTKTRKALWVELPDALAEALEATLPPREDRDPAAQLFAGVSADRLRTAIARACKAAGVPAFSPHDLRHRRISLLHQQGRSWAQIGTFVGQRKLSVTSDVYTHVLSDETELDYAALILESASRG